MTAGSAALVETRDRTWSPVLDGLRVTALDCIQTGLAALVDRAHGPGAHVVLGARPVLPVAVADGRTHVEPPASTRIAEAAELAGVRVAERHDGLDGPAVRRVAGTVSHEGALYVIADAHAMPWTPYEGRRHMEHSFLLVPDDGSFVVVDPYHNDTQWGASRPGVWRLTAADLDAVVAGSGAESGAVGGAGRVAAGAVAIVATAGPLPGLDAAAVLDANARAAAAATPLAERHVAAARAAVADATAVDQLVLDVWLLGRSRLLHAAWLATLPGLPPDVRAAADAHAQEWLRLASQSYVGARRVRRGAELPGSVLDRFAELLTADAGLAARLAAGSGPAGGPADGVRDVVADAVRVVLRLDAATAAAPQPLRALPGFNSFRLVDIIERVELQLGVHVDGDDLTPDALRDVDSLTTLFVRALTRAGR